MEYNEETKDQDMMDNDFESGGVKQWIQDNLRIIISVLVVVVIAAGIYSYSSRTEAPSVADNGNENSMLSEITSDEEKSTSDSSQVAEGKEDKTAIEKKDQQVSSSATSQETGNAFVETAIRGDGTTKLARRALANYLEKNSDSSLRAEHKIYIEDYLRKKVGHTGKVRVGTSVEFSKSLIQEAISKSKNLNDAQLKNLHKYAVRVPSLT